MIKAYHRADSLEHALQLQARAGVNTALLPGYDALLDETIDEVVDLQAVPLKAITVSGGTVTLEGLVTLGAVVEHPDVPEWLRTLARQEEPSTLRNMRTVASVILNASPESLLLAAFLACGAEVTGQGLAGTKRFPVAEFLPLRAEVFPAALSLAGENMVATAKVARTPADKPIVAAAACRAADGSVRLALCGVAETPILVSPDAVERLTPAGDFRGSSEYRKAVAARLSQRVLAQVEG